MVIAAFILPAPSQSLDNLGTIHTIAIGSLGDGDSAHVLRQKLVERVNRSGRLTVVADPASADAVLRGSSNIWATGAVVIDPRSHSSRQTNYQGYLSIELTGKANQSLWSYLVTPSRFRSGSITNDLADHAAARLLEAIGSGGAAASASPVPTRPQAHAALHAAGATLPAPLYLKWFESASIPVTYDAIGSEAGIEQLAAGKVDFAASDMPITDPQSLPGVKVVQIPTVIGAVVPIYNLPGKDRELSLTPEVLAGIYSGTIRKWNDARIRAANQGLRLPNADIAVVHRSDGSGTTFVWTSFLSEASREWKASVGSGTHVTWPVGAGAAGSQGLAEQVKKTPYSIGYVELIYAIQHELEYAAVRNPAGHFIKADLASITAAAEACNYPGTHMCLAIVNSPNKAAYPVSTFTWLLVPAAGLDASKKAAITDLLNWVLTSGQKQCASLGYVPLPREVAARALHAVDTLK